MSSCLLNATVCAGRRVLAALTLGVLTSGLTWAAEPLDDTALSDTWGQALLSLNTTNYQGMDFTRLTLGADISLSANFNGMRLGEYTWSQRNATGADIDLGTLRFGRSDGTAAQRTVSITDPYFEFVTTGSGSSQQVVGMRFGFGGISGDIGTTMNVVSGSLLIDAGAAGTIDSRNDTLGGKRWDGTTCVSTATCTLALSQIGGLHAGNADGASRDFFLAIQNQAVNYPSLVAGLAAPDTAQAGVWMNWRDRLSALNTTGTVPPNVGKGP